MLKENMQFVSFRRVFSAALALLLAATIGCAAPGGRTAGADQAAVMQAMDIQENVSCGRCGMYPAQYPRWQAQIIFKDGSMTPFDGCKCLFNFLFAMDKYDKNHSRDDVSVAWVKDFNSGAWLDADAAYYVVGSSMMGPMGKELIPFAAKAAAMSFQGEQGGAMMRYGEISPAVLESLGMGGMKMEQGSKHMKM